MKKYTLIITIRTEEGSTQVKYEGVSRDELLEDQKTTALLELHERSMPEEEPSE